MPDPSPAHVAVSTEAFAAAYEAHKLQRAEGALSESTALALWLELSRRVAIGHEGGGLFQTGEILADGERALFDTLTDRFATLAKAAKPMPADAPRTASMSVCADMRKVSAIEVNGVRFVRGLFPL